MDVEALTWAQLVQRCGSPARARALLADGSWWRVLRGADAPSTVDDGPVVRVRALRLVLPAGVALSHRAARSDTLVEAVAFGDAVLRSGAATFDQLEVALERAAGLRGVRQAREVVPHLEPRSESLMESRLRMRLVLGGLPRPEAQRDVYDEDGHVGRVDLAVEGAVFEYDGRGLLEPVFVHERRRQTGLAELQLEVRRFTSADYDVRPAAAVCAEAWRAVELARGRDLSRVRRAPDTLRAPRLRPLPTRADQARPRAA